MGFAEHAIHDVLKSIDRTLKRIAQALEDSNECPEVNYIGTVELRGEDND